MITLTMLWQVEPAYADDFLDLIADFTAACRAEPGCLVFEWTRCSDRPTSHTITETYRGLGALAHHAGYGHAARAIRLQSRYCTRFPRLQSVTWSRGPAELPAAT